MDKKPDLTDVFNYYRNKTSASALFIRVGNEYAYSIKNANGSCSIGHIALSLLEWAIDSWCANKSVQVITHIDGDGRCSLPDTDIIEEEKQLDY